MPKQPTDNPNDRPDPQGRFAYDGLDRVMHEKARLGILTSLVTHAKGLAFNDLKDLCSLTDGNLSRHLSVLSEAGLVELEKITDGRRQVSICRLTSTGRKRFLDYLSVLEQIVTDAMADKPDTQPAPHLREGFSPA